MANAYTVIIVVTVNANSNVVQGDRYIIKSPTATTKRLFKTNNVVYATGRILLHGYRLFIEISDTQEITDKSIIIYMQANHLVKE